MGTSPAYPGKAFDRNAEFSTAAHSVAFVHPPTFTLAFLYQQLDTLLGVGRWTCRVDYPAYLLTIGTHVEDKLHREELIHMVNQIKPANIVFGMYLFCDPVEAYAYIAAAPCGTSILASVRMPEIKKEDTQ